MFLLTAHGSCHADTTGSFESLDARFRRAVRRRRHVPTEQAAVQVLDLTGTWNREHRQEIVGRTIGGTPILSALTIHYGERVPTTPEPMTAAAMCTRDRTDHPLLEGWIGVVSMASFAVSPDG